MTWIDGVGNVLPGDCPVRRGTDDERFPVSGDIGGKQGNNDEAPVYLDVNALFDGGMPDPPEPELLYRTDGHAIFYRGQVNLLFGDPESGKTLVSQAAAAEALKDQQRVAFIDIDHNGAEATIVRFLDLDVDEDTLRDPSRFRYVEPEDRVHLRLIVASLVEWQADLVVVDSIGELLPLLGLSSNSPDDFTRAHAQVLKPLAKAGAAVIAIDHLPKASENKANGPTGTAAKRRAVGGVSIRVVIEEQFSPGQGGSCYLTVNKDRHGGLRRYCAGNPGKEQVAGLFKIAKGDDGIKWTLDAPKADDVPKIDRVDLQDLAELDKLDPPPTSVRDVTKRCKWRTDRATRVLRVWRSQRFPSVSGKRETEGAEVVSLFPTPVSGNGKHDPEPSGPDPQGDGTDRCGKCSYAFGPDPEQPTFCSHCALPGEQCKEYSCPCCPKDDE